MVIYLCCWCRELVVTCASLRAESQLSTHDAAPRASLTLKGQFFFHIFTGHVEQPGLVVLVMDFCLIDL